MILKLNAKKQNNKVQIVKESYFFKLKPKERGGRNKEKMGGNDNKQQDGRLKLNYAVNYIKHTLFQLRSFKKQMPK